MLSSSASSSRARATRGLSGRSRVTWRRRQESLGVRIMEQPVRATALLHPDQRHTERGLADTGWKVNLAHWASLPPGGASNARLAVRGAQAERSE